MRNARRRASFAMILAEAEPKIEMAVPAGPAQPEGGAADAEGRSGAPPAEGESSGTAIGRTPHDAWRVYRSWRGDDGQRDCRRWRRATVGAEKGRGDGGRYPGANRRGRWPTCARRSRAEGELQRAGWRRNLQWRARRGGVAKGPGGRREGQGYRE
eukprot:8829788-Pyramimonas_sp.AAC.2